MNGEEQVRAALGADAAHNREPEGPNPSPATITEDDVRRITREEIERILQTGQRRQPTLAEQIMTRGATHRRAR